MNFTINQKYLKGTLDKVVGVLPVKSPVPALDCIKLRIEKDKVMVTASDLNTWLLAMVKCESNGDNLEILLPGRKLYEIVNSLPEENILFKAEDGNIDITCQNVKHRISTMDAESYPKDNSLLKESGYIRIPREEFQKGLEAVAFASSKDPTSPMNGILFDLKGEKLKLGATDGYRLATSSLSAVSIGGDKEYKFIVPSNVAKYVSKMDGDEIRLFIEKALLGVYASNLGLNTRLVEGSFPDYEKVIPKDNDKKLLADRQELIHALQQIKVFAKEVRDTIEVEASENPGLTLSTKGEGFESQVKVNCQYKGSNLKFGLNAQYLLENLYAMPGKEVEWSLKTPTTPILLRPTNNDKENLYLLMPIRLQENAP